jgi:tRNA(adenine34) deaminase
MTAASTPRATDEQFMFEALAEAEAAGRAGDVPVGALVVLGGHIIGRGGNRRERDADPTAHAEMIALRQAAQAISSWRLVGATLYVTQEPCPMCAGAIVHARVARVVFGCKNPKAGAVRTLYQLLEDPRLNHRAEVVSGVLEEPTSELIRRFFAELRKP